MYIWSYVFMFIAVLCLVAQLCLTLCDPIDCSLPGSSVHGGFPTKNTGVGCHALLQEIFPTQGPNPSLLHCRRIRYHLSHQGSPSQLLEWVVYPFSRGSSQHRNWTGISCIAGGFFTSWATREVLMCIEVCVKVCSKMSNSPLSHNPSNSYHSPQSIAPLITFSIFLCILPNFIYENISKCEYKLFQSKCEYKLFKKYSLFT